MHRVSEALGPLNMPDGPPEGDVQPWDPADRPARSGGASHGPSAGPASAAPADAGGRAKGEGFWTRLTRKKPAQESEDGLDELFEGEVELTPSRRGARRARGGARAEAGTNWVLHELRANRYFALKVATCLPEFLKGEYLFPRK